jgi:hypothetical protein
MGRTILRVLDGTELSAELSSKLKELLPEFTIEPFKEKPDYKNSIKRRMDSLHAAFLFILDAHPLDPKFTRITKETLTIYANDALRACDLSSERFKDWQRELEKFTGALISVLRSEWPWPDGDALTSAISCLNEAEQYVLMREGRPDIATLTPMDFGRGPEYILQWDESLPPYSEQWLAELKTIKANAAFITPGWFRGLKEHEHAYFANLLSDVDSAASISPDRLIADLEELLVLLDTEKKATPSIAWGLELQNIHAHKPPFSKWFSSLSKPRQEMIRVLSGPSTVTTLEDSIQKCILFLTGKKTDPAFTAELRNSISMPLWYALLPNHQQFFLKHVLKDARKIEDVVSFLSSRHRTLPAPANFGRHSILRLNNDEVLPLSAKRFRSSHISSRDVIPLKSGLPRAIQQRHCDSNLAHIMSYATAEQRILLQTLISPLDFIPESVAASLPDRIPPDWALFQQARDTVVHSEHAPRIFQHNHPYNYAKIYYYTTSRDPDSLRLIAKTRETIAAVEELQRNIGKLKKDISSLLLKLEGVPAENEKEKKLLKDKIGVLREEVRALEARLPVFSQRIDDIKGLIEEYNGVLNSSFGSATLFDYNGRELFLSSLEQLIILTQEGYSYGSCVSGKDRKAMELMHTDAMLIYKDLYGHWPSFAHASSSPERIRFVTIVAKLYLSHHQHELAGQNAPGSEGIKTPSVYLPADICAEISRLSECPEGLDYDDKLATNNEVRHISKHFSEGSEKMYIVPTPQLKATLIARQLGNELCTQLYNSLLGLLNQRHLFKPKPNLNLIKEMAQIVAQSFFAKDVLPTGIAEIKKVMKEPSSGDTNIERMAKIIAIVSQRPPDEASRTDTTKIVYEGINALTTPSVKNYDLVKYATDLARQWNSLFERSKAERIKEESSSDEDVSSPSPGRETYTL